MRNVFRRLLIPLLAGFAVLVGVTGQASAAPASTAPASTMAPDSGVHVNDVGATLVGADITFSTLTDNKDADTLLTVVVRDRNNRVAAQTSGFFGQFGDQTTKLLPLRVRPGATWDNLENGGATVTITITPNGNDTWNFAYVLDLSYSDGDFGFHNNPGTSLNQNKRTLTDPLD